MRSGQLCDVCQGRRGDFREWTLSDCWQLRYHFFLQVRRNQLYNFWRLTDSFYQNRSYFDHGSCNRLVIVCLLVQTSWSAVLRVDRWLVNNRFRFWSNDIKSAYKPIQGFQLYFSAVRLILQKHLSNNSKIVFLKAPENRQVWEKSSFSRGRVQKIETQKN